MTPLEDDERETEGPIPPAEDDNLLMTFADAMELAEADDVAGGHDLLAGGLSRAQDLETAGEEWGGALVARYQHAIRRFTEDYGPADEEP